MDKDSNKNGEINLQQEVAEYQAKTHELQTIIEKQVGFNLSFSHKLRLIE
jgi:hypothetical protein